ncbi:class I SAM-dependent methyltransferase [Pararhodospirillum photometricum]|uniref:Uncharacterized protein n=1 Tax=Pararhodospirillum photometricum DSM 122 TaxID=1150469 RepID=H6SNW2_PARPM|nr:SAM-dependent methyltransferase [Pararhodospirillum photometricum]CCG07034.1 Putative uncharacterized protein [Pararhodospirillum photometricum DSM 122]
MSGPVLPPEGLPLETWMGQALAAYYARGTALGARGDFITAPEVSQMVGELLGLWAAVVWQGLGQPSALSLVELGPGRGTLMADAWRALAVVPACRAALSIHLVETSPGLRALQARALADAPVTWHDSLDSVPQGQPQIFLANEFLDALPIRSLARDEAGAWHERWVVRDGQGALAFAWGPALDAPPAEVQPAHRAARPGEICEICPAAHRLVAALAQRLCAAGGAALFLDYGPAASAPGDSLQALRAHRFVPVLETPGEADLTAHVDFAALAATAAAHGAQVAGVVGQGEFLCALGLRERAGVLMSAADPAQQRDIAAAVRRLVDPTAMGTHFKVMGLASPTLGGLPGF